MLDKLAGIYTQLQELKKSLKQFSPSKDPKRYKEILDALEATEARYEKLKKLKQDRIKVKEQNTPPKIVWPKSFNPNAPISPKPDTEEKSPIPLEVVSPDKQEVAATVEPLDKKSPATQEEFVGKDKVSPKKTFKLDDVVSPVRGGESVGRVMRYDGDGPESLVYVAWDEGPLKERDVFGGYYPADLKLKEEPKSLDDKTAETDHMADLKSNYMDLLADLKAEHQEALEKHDHIWVARLQKKIDELQAKIDSKFGMRENGSGGTEQLTVVDHTTPSDNDTSTAGGKDSDDEYADQWAEPDGRDLESAKGVKGSVFNAETAQSVVDRLKSEISAPFVNAYASSLGGAENISILLTIGFDPKETWINGIFENSRYNRFHIYNDGTVENFQGSMRESKFRKRNVKSVDELIQVLNSYASSVSALPKTSSKKASSQHIPVTVFKRTWKAVPLGKEGSKEFKGYDLFDETDRKVLNINPTNKKMSSQELQKAVERELSKGLKHATLIQDIPFLKKGSEVFIIGLDKNRVKIASLTQGIRAWVGKDTISVLSKKALKQQIPNELPTKLPVILPNQRMDVNAGVSKQQEDAIKAILSNDEASSDDELVQHFINEIGIPEQEARGWVAKRNNFLGNMFASKNKGNIKKAEDEFEQEESFDDNQPLEDDIIIQTEGRLGSMYGAYQMGTQIAKAVEWDDIANAVKQHMEKNPNFFPTVWFQDDHGGLQVVNLYDKTASLKVSKQGICQSCRTHKDVDAYIVPGEGEQVLCEECKDKIAKEQRIQYDLKYNNKRPFSKRDASKKKIAEGSSDPYNTLVTQIQSFKERISEVQQRIQQSPTKVASDNVKDGLSAADVIEDIEMALDLLESKVNAEEHPDAHASIEAIENLLWSVEDQVGVPHPLPEHESIEPEHAGEVEKRKNLPEEVEKESSVEKKADDPSQPPTTPPTQGFKWAWEPQSRTWILVATGNAGM